MHSFVPGKSSGVSDVCFGGGYLLTENIKDKNKPQASSHVYRHTRKRNEVGEDDTAADVDVSELEKCREHLNSILALWDPVFPAPPSTHGGEALRAGDAGGEAVAVTCASIHIVTKWLVRSLAGQSSLKEQDVSPVLRWLQNHVLPHLAAVREMLRDETLRNNLFRLYTRLCQASSTSAGLCRQLGALSSIMLQLMEERGLSSTFHELVKSLCRSAAVEEDADKTGDLSCSYHSCCEAVWEKLGNSLAFLIHEINSPISRQAHGCPKQKLCLWWNGGRGGQHGAWSHWEVFGHYNTPTPSKKLPFEGLKWNKRYKINTIPQGKIVCKKTQLHVGLDADPYCWINEGV